MQKYLNQANVDASILIVCFCGGRNFSHSYYNFEFIKTLLNCKMQWKLNSMKWNDWSSKPILWLQTARCLRFNLGSIQTIEFGSNFVKCDLSEMMDYHFEFNTVILNCVCWMWITASPQITYVSRKYRHIEAPMLNVKCHKNFIRRLIIAAYVWIRAENVIGQFMVCVMRWNDFPNSIGSFHWNGSNANAPRGF